MTGQAYAHRPTKLDWRLGFGAVVIVLVVVVVVVVVAVALLLPPTQVETGQLLFTNLARREWF